MAQQTLQHRPHNKEETKQWVISMAGFNLAVTVDDPAVVLEAHRIYSSFTAEAEPDFAIEMNVRTGRDGQKARPMKTVSTGGVWQIDSYNFSGELDTSSASARFSIEPNWGAFDSVLRVTLSILLAQEGGVLVHASSVSREGKAFVFAARPEGGKSTVAGMLNDGVVIGDELVAIRRGPNGVIVYGTPFWNGGPTVSDTPAQAPAQAIFLLTKADQTSARRLEPAQMTAKLIPHIFFDPDNLKTSRATIDALADITQTVPGYQLRFGLDADALRRCLDEID